MRFIISRVQSVNLWHKEGNLHSFIEYLMYLPKEKQVFIPYLNGVDMFRNANLTSNTGYTCKMLKTMRGSLASLSGYGVCLKNCYWLFLANRLYGRVSTHSIN